jgi:putative colanic acid biosynthesis glycosyltransferase
MKKILILNTTFDKGGAAGVARDLFYYFKNNPDFSVFFAYGRGKKKTESNTFKFGNSIESFIHIFLVRFLGLEGFGSYFSTRKLINFIEKEKFDLIHIHNLHGYYVNFFKLLEYLNKKNIKVIWTLHDEWILTWLPAHSMGCEHCKTLKGTCTNKYNYPKNYWPLFSNFMLGKKREILSYKNITFVSPAVWLYNECKDEFKLTNSILIPNGIDSKIFIPSTNKEMLKEKYKLPKDKKIILFLASNFKDKNKGGKYIVSLADKLKEKNYLLCVLGSADLPKRINLLSFGYISNQKDLAEIYALSDVFCSLSSVETSPLSVLYAMSCSLPIVGFEIKALDELVSNNGKLVDYGDEETLTNIICDIIENDSLLKDMGENSRKSILTNFEKENAYLLYEKEYKL